MKKKLITYLLEDIKLTSEQLNHFLSAITENDMQEILEQPLSPTSYEIYLSNENSKSHLKKCLVNSENQNKILQQYGLEMFSQKEKIKIISNVFQSHAQKNKDDEKIIDLFIDNEKRFNSELIEIIEDIWSQSEYYVAKCNEKHFPIDIIDFAQLNFKGINSYDIENVVILSNKPITLKVALAIDFSPFHLNNFFLTPPIFQALQLSIEHDLKHFGNDYFFKLLQDKDNINYPLFKKLFFLSIYFNPVQKNFINFDINTIQIFKSLLLDLCAIKKPLTDEFLNYCFNNTLVPILDKTYYLLNSSSLNYQDPDHNKQSKIEWVMQKAVLDYLITYNLIANDIDSLLEKLKSPPVSNNIEKIQDLLDAYSLKNNNENDLNNPVKLL